MIVANRVLQRLALGLLVIYGALSAYVNLAHFLGLPPIRGQMVAMLTLLAFVFTLIHALVFLGWTRLLWLFGLTFVISILFESVGVETGLIYGPYHYTDQLGARFLGLVPYLIPVAWFMMIYPSQIIAEGLVGARTPKGWRRELKIAGLSAVVMTAWDVVMDPIMVRMGNWVWDVKGGYFGVPLHNYIGWLATTFTIYILFRILESRLVARRIASLYPGFVRLAVWSYLITWASNTLAALQMGLSGPALAGSFSAGVLAFLGLLNVGQESNSSD
jgi:uncharacterized membrane protein